MKKYKFILPIVLVVLMAASCISIVNNAVTEKKEYNAYIESAQIAVEKKISIDVDAAYSKALDINSNVNDFIAWGKYYSDNGDYGTAISIGENALLSFSKDAKIYAFLMENYKMLNDYETFFETYKKCVSIGATNDDVINLYEQNKYAFSLDFDSFGTAYPFSSGVARITENNYGSSDKVHFGYVSASGMINPQFVSAGDFNSDEISVAPVVDKNGEAYYINKEGRKKYVVSPEGISVKELGFYSSKVLSVFDGEKYYLCDINSNIIAGPFEYLSTINNNIGVIKEGDNWKIINEKGEQISNQTFSNIVLDSKKIAYRNGLFAEIGDKYYLINENGEKITETAYDDAKLFVDGFAAVKSNGKWGFIDKNGNLVIDFKYHDAQSFSNGFAAVKMNDKWGYITYSEKDKIDNVAIDYQFEDAVGFSTTSRVSIVKLNNQWKLLKLYV